MLIIDQSFIWIVGILLGVIGFLLRQIWLQVSNHLKELSLDISEIKRDVGLIKTWQGGADQCMFDITERLKRIENMQNGEGK